MSQNLEKEVQRRRTFGIISHPDAGKTTLTEKLLLFGGAIHVAGAIKAKKASRHATSDFMEIEKQRGISVSTSVMGFEYNNIKINLLDTPGHKDFCEDTYRTLTAVDSAIMVIDATKGVESQTYKLLEVCQSRQTPIITFLNKLDREGKETIELLDEIEDKLNITVCPMSWPIGMGKSFKGVYNLTTQSLTLFKPHTKQTDSESIQLTDLNDPRLLDHIPADLATTLRDEIALITEVYPPFSQDAYNSGKITPVFFGSALNNFGVKELLDCFIRIAPSPLSRETDIRTIHPMDSEFTGFIFKIHANIDPKHRDRIAFLRICSGVFERNKKYIHVQSEKPYRSANPTAFMAQEKQIIDYAYPGDIIGLHDTGTLKIGDSITSSSRLTFKGIPNFSPELFQSVINYDPLRYKQLKKGLVQLCEEGVAQVFTRHLDQKQIVGTVGHLQFDVIAYRLENEYGTKCQFSSLDFIIAAWIDCDKATLEDFIQSRRDQIAYDKDNHPVYLAKTKWSLEREIQENPSITFRFTSEK